MQEETRSAKVFSVNVSGALRSEFFAGQWVKTGFFKSAVKGTARVHKLGIAGDAQADLSVHGGPEKAVYFYPHEYYASWEKLLGEGPLLPGSFGENITSLGMQEDELFIGDILRVGTATLQVLQPRSPCYKLQLRFGRPDMTALFFRQGRPGWYASVLEEGAISAGDEIVVMDRAPGGVTVADIWRLSAQEEHDERMVERVRQLTMLPDSWKDRIGRRARDEKSG